MTHIFIAEEIPSLNKGEAGILLGALKSFETLGDVKVSLLSSRSEIDRIRYPTKVKIINGRQYLHLLNTSLGMSVSARALRIGFCALQHSLFAVLYRIFGLYATKMMKGEIWKQYINSDLIIIGHGNTILSISHLYIILFAELLKKSIVIFAGGTKHAGIRNKLLLILNHIVLNKVDLILLREKTSYSHLQKMGIDKPPMYVTADLAFLLQPAPPERVLEIILREEFSKKKPMIGIVVRRIMFHYAFPDLKNLKQKYDKCIKVIAQVVNYLTDALNVTVIFLPHSFDPREGLDDRIMAKDIYQIAKNKHNIKIITNEYMPEELKGLIGQFDLLISARTHPIIAASTMYIPFIAMSCPPHQRAYGIIGEMLGQQKWVYNVRNLSSETLILKISEAWSMKDEIRKDLMSKIETVKERALHNGELIRDLLQGKLV